MITYYVVIKRVTSVVYVLAAPVNVLSLGIAAVYQIQLLGLYTLKCFFFKILLMLVLDGPADSFKFYVDVMELFSTASKTTISSKRLSSLWYLS